MARQLTLLAAVLASRVVVAQQIGTYTPEVHPVLPSWECTVKGGCVAKNTSVVLDSDYRWTHTVGGYDNCKPNGLNKTLCPDAATCAKNCALEGVNYASYGIITKGGELTLELFVNDSSTGNVKLSSPRVYLLANDSSYNMFHLLDKEFAFDVDVSKLPCGSNGALYFSEMLAGGGQGNLNPAGPAFGTGYCDAQCPTPGFINGQVKYISNRYK
jgi:cellulose 1,4-beta-cellobiosidase